MSLQRIKVVMLAAVVVVAIAVAGYFARSTIRGPEPQTIEQITEPPLPNDPIEAEIVIRQRYLGDKVDGLDKKTREQRQQARLRQLADIRRKAVAVPRK